MKKIKFAMKYIISPIVLIFLLFYSIFVGATGHQISNNLVIKSNNQTVIFLNAENAYNYLSKSEFFDHWNDYFDASIRLKKDLSAFSKSQNLNTYKSFLRKQCMNWGQNNIERITKIINSAQTKIAIQSKQILQDTLFLIKTTGAEEFDAYYTNQKAIVIPKKELEFLTLKARRKYVEEIIIHEYFHIYTRYNITKREELYSTIGFSRLNTLSIPNDLEQKRISNPDSYDLNYVVALKDSLSGTTNNYAMLLISNYQKYDGIKSFIGLFSALLDYLDVQFHLVDVNGNVQIAKFEVGNEIYDKTGTISGYSIGVDEILAEAFRILVTKDWQNNNILSLRDKEILMKMKIIID